MPIDDDRQSKSNNRPGAVLRFIEAVDAIEVSFVPSPAVVERHAQSRAEHEHAKVHGRKATQNRAVSAWRKTDEGKAQRNPKDRKAYEEEAASQGNTVRNYTRLTDMTDEQKADHARKLNTKSQRQRRKKRTDNMTPEELAAHRKAESAKRTARRDNAKKV